jgi:D-beta-D-heptose 7-phosphate kinase / D-beta-D-heptose 1-phosphate adenosyltransferase
MISDALLVHSLEELKKLREELAAAGKRVGWTGGTFDILHAGHVESFRTIREQCDFLLVTANSNASPYWIEKNGMCWQNGALIRKDSREQVLLLGEPVTRLNWAADTLAQVCPTGRPVIQSQSVRMALLRSCRYVDAVYCFDEATPEELLHVWQPHIAGKGGDYELTPQSLPELPVIEQYGGKCILVPHTIDISTTQIVGRILRSY